MDVDVCETSDHQGALLSCLKTRVVIKHTDEWFGGRIEPSAGDAGQQWTEEENEACYM